MAKAKKKKAKKAAKAVKARKAPAKKSAARKTKTKTKAVKTKAVKAKARPAKKKTAKPAAKKAAPAKVAAKKPAPRRKQKTVGEGDYEASRTFLKDQANFVKKNKAGIADMGREAERALDGPEGADLRAAEVEAASHSKTAE